MKNQTQADEQVQRILDGNEHIVSHNGTSQYKSRTGNSACGLAALNFARVMLAKVDAGRNDILQEIIVKNTTAKVGATSRTSSEFLTHCISAHFYLLS